MNKAILEDVIREVLSAKTSTFNSDVLYRSKFKEVIDQILSDERLSEVVDVEPNKFDHEIKILPNYFKSKLDGLKTFEIRLNDRDYKVGDSVKLNEYDGGYTGRYVWGYIDYITCYEQKPRFIVFTHSIKNTLSSVAPVEDWISISESPDHSSLKNGDWESFEVYVPDTFGLQSSTYSVHPSGVGFWNRDDFTHYVKFREPPTTQNQSEGQ